MKVAKGYKLPVIRSIDTRDVKYNWRNVMNTCCMLYVKCVKRLIPEFSSKGKNFF